MQPVSRETIADSRVPAKVAKAALETFGSEAKAQRWLERPTTVFAGESPAAVALTGSEGMQKVLDVLSRIDHGLAV